MIKNILILLLFIVIVVGAFFAVKMINKPADTKNIVLSNIMNRKSVRLYKKEKISEEKLLKLVKAGMAAPSAVNIQPWEFYVVDDENLLQELSNTHSGAKMVKNAAAAIVVAGNMDAYNGRENLQEYWVQDTSAATQNILLAVEAMELGAVWTGVYPVSDRVNKVKQDLNLPENIIPLNIIAIGYPLEKTEPKNKWNEEKIHWNKQ